MKRARYGPRAAGRHAANFDSGARLRLLDAATLPYSPSHTQHAYPPQQVFQGPGTSPYSPFHTHHTHTPVTPPGQVLQGPGQQRRVGLLRRVQPHRPGGGPLTLMGALYVVGFGVETKAHSARRVRCWMGAGVIFVRGACALISPTALSSRWVFPAAAPRALSPMYAGPRPHPNAPECVYKPSHSTCRPPPTHTTPGAVCHRATDPQPAARQGVGGQEL